VIVYSTFNVATLSIYIYNNNNNKTQLHGTRAYRVSFSFTPSFRFLFRTSHNIGNCGGKSRKNKNFCIYYIRRSPLLGSSQKPGGGAWWTQWMSAGLIPTAVCQLWERERERDGKTEKWVDPSVSAAGCSAMLYLSPYIVCGCVSQGLRKPHTAGKQIQTQTVRLDV
jgi:hypothetical protein